jgi:hypothetical protein
LGDTTGDGVTGQDLEGPFPASMGPDAKGSLGDGQSPAELLVAQAGEDPFPELTAVLGDGVQRGQEHGRPVQLDDVVQRRGPGGRERRVLVHLFVNGPPSRAAYRVEASVAGHPPHVCLEPGLATPARLLEALEQLETDVLEEVRPLRGQSPPEGRGRGADPTVDERDRACVAPKEAGDGFGVLL